MDTAHPIGVRKNAPKGGTELSNPQALINGPFNMSQNLLHSPTLNINESRLELTKEMSSHVKIRY
jgi:hypothetical protein